MSSALGGGVASSSSATRARSPRAEGVPELADGGASLGQEPGHVPEAITDGVVERGADRAARRVESRADVDEDDGHVNVAARCPVQRGLRLRAAGPCVGIGPGVDQQPRRGGGVREVAVPVGGDVQRGAPAALVAALDPGRAGGGAPLLLLSGRPDPTGHHLQEDPMPTFV